MVSLLLRVGWSSNHSPYHKGVVSRTGTTPEPFLQEAEQSLKPINLVLVSLFSHSREAEETLWRSPVHSTWNTWGCFYNLQVSGTIYSSAFFSSELYQSRKFKHTIKPTRFIIHTDINGELQMRSCYSNAHSWGLQALGRIRRVPYQPTWSPQRPFLKALKRTHANIG